MWRLGLLLLGLLLSGQGRPVPVSHVLAWDYALEAAQWFVDQCENRGQRCPFTEVAVLPGAARTIEIGELAHNRSYCWRVRLPSGQVSNLVCT